MRHIFTSTHLLFISLTFSSKLAFSQYETKLSADASTLVAARPAQQTLPHGISKDWYSKATLAAEDREYAINNLDRGMVYGAVNHAQHLGYWFTADGYLVKSFNEDGSSKDTWQTRFVLEGIGREGKLIRQQLVKAIQTDDHSLQMNYKDYSVLYNNEKAGMEQSFLLRKRPAGNHALRIALELQGDLSARIDNDNALVLSTTGHPNDVKLMYDQLKVWDKNHHLLPARMTLNEGHQLVLTVDDRKAEYPITVDPFAHGFNQIIDVENVLHTTVADASVHTLFGYSVNGAGDVNGDGLKDIIVGAPAFAAITGFVSSGGGTDGTLTLNTGIAVTGAAFIYFGVSGSAPSTTPSKVLQPSNISAGALFGYSVASTGNAGATGHSGVIIGAPGAQVTFTYGTPTILAIGQVYVYTSNLSGNVALVSSTPDVTLSLTKNDFNSGVSIPTRNPMYGFSVADAGDVDGDGIDDMIVGSPLYNDNFSNGRVDIYKGSATGVSATPQSTLLGGVTGELFGFSVSTAGKVNNDALADVIVGAPGALLTGALIQSHAYVFYGKSGGITTTSDLFATGTIGTTLSEPSIATGSLFGFSVSTAGDVDNDTHSDVIVGAPLALNTSGTFGNYGANGKAYVFYGSGNANGIGTPSHAVSTLASPRAAGTLNLLFGYSVGSAGNITGDAAGDVLVGEPGSLGVSNGILTSVLGSLGFSGSGSVTGGQAYVFNGVSGTGVSTTSRYTATATAPSLLGTSVNGVGDVDGDGFNDFVVGQPSGTLDLGFSLQSLGSSLGGPTSLAGTLTTAANDGLVTNSSVGNMQLFFGFTGPLPVTLLNFTGQTEATDVLLNWSTAIEANSDYYQIERSPDNQHFTAIGKVTAVHNSNVETDYSYTDASPLSGNNYYRLRMVDMDGSATYSKIVVISFSNSNEHFVATYPNPAHGSFQLVFRNMAAGRYAMNLISPTGQMLFTRNVQVSDPHQYTETVNLSAGLAQGTYVVRLVDQQNHTFITRVVVE